jgi:uncharacterized membrane protein
MHASRGRLRPKRWWGGLLLGAGGFQLYDGIVQHKLLGLHRTCPPAARPWPAATPALN